MTLGKKTEMAGEANQGQRQDDSMKAMPGVGVCGSESYALYVQSEE